MTETKRKTAGEEFEEEMLAWLRENEAPKAEVVPGPWKRRKLTEQELVNQQSRIDEWWQRHLDDVAEREAEPSPERRISDWTWGRS
jgi:hypothetical protein